MLTSVVRTVEGLRWILSRAAFGHSEAASEEEHMLIVAHTRLLAFASISLFQLKAVDAIFLNMVMNIAGLDRSDLYLYTNNFFRGRKSLRTAFRM